MTIAAHVIKPLFSGFVAEGLEGTSTEIRHVLVNVVGGSLFANKTSIEYAIWPASQLGSLGSPAFKANNGTTNASGEFVLATPGYFPNDEVVAIFRQAAGSTGGIDDLWASGAILIKAS